MGQLFKFQLFQRGTLILVLDILSTRLPGAVGRVLQHGGDRGEWLDGTAWSSLG